MNSFDKESSSQKCGILHFDWVNAPGFVGAEAQTEFFPVMSEACFLLRTMIYFVRLTIGYVPGGCEQPGRVTRCKCQLYVRSLAFRAFQSGDRGSRVRERSKERTARGDTNCGGGREMFLLWRFLGSVRSLREGEASGTEEGKSRNSSK
jgi:hypothetical protein